MKKLILFSLTIISLQARSGFSADRSKPEMIFSQQEILGLWESGQKSEALKQVDKWMGHDKKSPEPYVTAANLAYEQKKYKKVLTLGEKALDRSSESAGGYYWRGRAFEALKNNLDAANEYRAAMLADPTFTAANDALTHINEQLTVPGLESRGQDSETKQ